MAFDFDEEVQEALEEANSASNREESSLARVESRSNKDVSNYLIYKL